jgi:hypothetical protein
VLTTRNADTVQHRTRPVKFTDISTAIGTWSELLGHAHAFRCSDFGSHRGRVIIASRVRSLAAFLSRNIPKSFSVILYLPSLTAFSLMRLSVRNHASVALRL